MQHVHYRPDVDGLRAVAVLAVIAFHAFPNVLPGGFVGVDIFFVISGFLITKIIVASLEAKDFSFRDFYVRRIRRIFPALCVVLFTALLVGWLVLLPDEYKQFGKHLAAAAAFLSNFALLREAGYFDAAAETKPLLHLWSLGIEEQFYILWPLLLWALSRARQRFGPWLAALTVGSFALNVALTADLPEAAFFLPVSRFWELAIGGVLAISLPPPNERGSACNVLSVAGLALLAMALFAITQATPFPGWAALLPVSGAAALIAAGPQGWANRRVLSLRTVVYIGRISYPVYLWHWILLCFASISIIGGVPIAIRAALVVASLGLGAITYHLVEQPIRRARTGGKPLVGAMAAIFMAGVIIYFHDGFKAYAPAAQSAVLDYYENAPPRWSFYEREGILKAYRDDCNFYDVAAERAGKVTLRVAGPINPSCYTPRNRDPIVFLWGDSHAQQLLPGLSRELPEGWQLLQVASSGCSPAAIERPGENYCIHSNWFAFQKLRELKPAVVVLAQDSGHSLDGPRALAIRLRNEGVGKVIAVGPVPHWRPALYKIVARTGAENFPRRLVKGLEPHAVAAGTSLRQGLRGDEPFIYVAPMDVLCNADGCLTYLGDDVVKGLTTFDYGHLAIAASRLVAREILVPQVVARRQ